ncbi:MAG: glycosyltransferase family 4 protein [Christensenellales bacterium]|jgi:glycosyltransferase EpsD
MKKVLFVSHTSNFVKFNLPYMAWFRQQGWSVHYASTEEEPLPEGCCDVHYKVRIERSPYSFNNIKAYFHLKKILQEERYDIIHCHTPMGGVVARLAARKYRKQGTRVIYTVHGFHFFQGAPRFNWLVFYPVEKWLARYTDCLITMNQEDYQIAVEKNFRARQIVRIDGVGVNTQRFYGATIEEKNALRLKFGFPLEAFCLIYIAEFIPRKNHAFLLEAISELQKRIPNLAVILAGTGDLLDCMKQKADALGIHQVVRFVGYSSKVDEFCRLADVMVSTSNQEGLPISLIEGMASGLPIVSSKIRGSVDLITEGRNGFLYNIGDQKALIDSVEKLYKNPSLRGQLGKNNVLDVAMFSVDHAVEEMAKIYQEYM